MWAQAFGLAIPNLQRELGFSDKEYGNLGSSFSAGVTAGAFVWGVLVDVIGRLSIIYISCHNLTFVMKGVVQLF